MNNNNNNEYNIKLYNSVFNNVYLKKIIFNHLSIYNILYNNIRFQSQKQLEQFRYKDYLNNITLDYEEYGDLSQLFENIKHIEIVRMNKDNQINNLASIPNHIQSIKLKTILSYLDIESKLLIIDSTILSKITSFYMNLSSGKEVLNKALQSITDLRIGHNKIELKKEMLPVNLKRIRLNNVISIENGCLFESLSSASLNYCSPLIVNQIFSNNLVRLEFICNNEDNKYKFDSSITFPESLQELTIQCYSFSSKLPSNLKTLYIVLYDLEDTIIFPPSLEDIIVSTSFWVIKQIFNNKESVPCNLKSLEFSCSSIIDKNGESILPNKLEKLIFEQYIDFDQVLQANQLPSSLTYLDLGNSYNQVIDINVLPTNLKTLVLGGGYRKIINPLAIPQQLELLLITSQRYNHPINLPVSTHPNIVVECMKLSLYYNPSNSSILKLRLPRDFDSSLSTLQLQDKSSLEYLHLGIFFNQPIELSDLPTNNNIKTLELSYSFNQTINLEHFRNLETLIVHHPNLKIITTTITTQQETIYNNYNLKNIILPPYNRQVLIDLDKNFYQFIKFK